MRHVRGWQSLGDLVSLGAGVGGYTPVGKALWVLLESLGLVGLWGGEDRHGDWEEGDGLSVRR